MSEQQKSSNGKYYIIIFGLAIALWAYGMIKNYFDGKSRGQYGINFNPTRKRLGVPVIEPNWHITHADETSVEWMGAEKVLGHKRKIVAFTGGTLDGEYDAYTLQSQNNQGRWLSIIHAYNKGLGIDSVKYQYQFNHTSRTITKQIADSLLAAEHLTENLP